MSLTTWRIIWSLWERQPKKDEQFTSISRKEHKKFTKKFLLFCAVAYIIAHGMNQPIQKIQNRLHMKWRIT
jgi:hypothetical protein